MMWTMVGCEPRGSTLALRRDGGDYCPPQGGLRWEETEIMRNILMAGMAIVVTLFAVPGTPAAPQRGSGGVLTGVVLGPDDKPVPHASITYQSSAGVAPHAVRADSRGNFTITRLKADNYDLRASGLG